MSIKASKSLLGLGLAASLSLSSGIAAAAANIAVLVNDTLVKSGEQIGIKVVFDCDEGVYNAYMWIEGGQLPVPFAINQAGQFVPKTDSVPPLHADIQCANLTTVKEKIVTVLPKIDGKGLTGSYKLTAALAAAGTLDFNPTDNVEVIIE